LVGSKQIARLKVGVEFDSGFAGRISLSSASLSDERGLGISNNKSCFAELLSFFLIN
jgi:hypothetical protein